MHARGVSRNVVLLTERYPQHRIKIMLASGSVRSAFVFVLLPVSERKQYKHSLGSLACTEKVFFDLMRCRAEY